MSSSVKPELVALSMSLLRPANARCVGRCVREFDARRGSRESHQEASLDRVKEERGGASFGRGGQNPAFVMSGAVDPLSRRTGRGKPGRDGQLHMGCGICRGLLQITDVTSWRHARGLCREMLPHRANSLSGCLIDIARHLEAPAGGKLSLLSFCSTWCFPQLG
ncbi:hypothetical protein F442_20440 [Phytophthora nicotianae P10297]|uniref:Uncharacterized protein n=3 Tax=Phytophthora nicotianae TaxID=4792 RepID=W2Y7A4_PHYNI|nr:hypothetical protein L914_19822 [Phytophthora nicotianae]ETO61317.1 hypothetical protein F444_20651 [Phytophthora nicotianae P1976]ETP30597.1 hypothetical protein F442_20440 [Phytophthora nicotianae P10297]